jgi:hypothetical protein
MLAQATHLPVVVKCLYKHKFVLCVCVSASIHIHIHKVKDNYFLIINVGTTFAFMFSVVLCELVLLLLPFLSLTFPFALR